MHAEAEAPPLFGRIPLDVYLMLTQECNFDCKYCIRDTVRDLPTWMSVDLAESILNSLQGLTVRRIVLTGGEPLLHPDLCHILMQVQRLYPVVICTNGWLLAEQIAHLIESNRLAEITIQVSLDSTEDQHDCTVRRQGSFARVIAGINLANTLGVKPVIATTLGRDNADMVSGLFDELSHLEIKAWRISAEMVCPRDGRSNALLDVSDWNAIVAWLQRLPCAGGIERIEARPMFAFNADTKPRQLSELANMLGGCAAGKTRVYFRTDGSISLCPLLDDFVVYPARTDFSDWWKSTHAMDDFRHFRIERVQPCAACGWRDVCKGGCHGTALKLAGSPFAVDPRCPHIKW